MRACTSPNSLANLLQESPASVLQKTSPLTLLASRKSGSAACVARFQIVPLGVSGNGRVSQVAPLSVLEKISRGVMVNNVFGGPTVMARLWMSESVTPLVTTSHVLPPSLLCRTPSTSRPAQMCWWSTGSTTSTEIPKYQYVDNGLASLTRYGMKRRGNEKGGIRWLHLAG